MAKILLPRPLKQSRPLPVLRTNETEHGCLRPNYIDLKARQRLKVWPERPGQNSATEARQYRILVSKARRKHQNRTEANAKASLTRTRLRP